jgi:hypothetical protein
MTLALCTTALAETAEARQARRTGNRYPDPAGAERSRQFTAPGQKDKRNAQAEGLNTDKIEEAIAALRRGRKGESDHVAQRVVSMDGETGSDTGKG